MSTPLYRPIKLAWRPELRSPSSVSCIMPALTPVSEASALHRQTCEISPLELEAVLTEHPEVISTYAAPGVELRAILACHTLTLSQWKAVGSGTMRRR